MSTELGEGAALAPSRPSGEEEAPVERLHPFAIVSGFGKAVREAFAGFAAGGFFAVQGRIGLAAIIAGLVAVMTFGGLLLHWWRFSFRVGADAIRIDSGILSRNHRTVPFDRVADVSITQGPLQRLVGVARVTLETGGGGGEDGVLGGIRLERAQALREHVRARRARLATTAEIPAFAGTTEEERPPLFAMDGRRVLTAGLFNFSLALFAGLFGVSQTFGDLADIDPFERRFWQPMLERSGWGEWLLDHQLGLAVGGLAVLVLAGVVTGIVRTLLREHGFRLERTGNGFRRRRGLLTKTDVSLPLKRIQAGLIATGPVRDRFGWRAFKVLSLAGESGGEAGKEAGSSDHVLAPLARDGEIAPIAGEIGLAMPRPETGWRPVSKAHVMSFMAFLGPLMLLIAGASAVALLIGGAEPRAFAGPPLITGGLFLLLGGMRWLEWRRTAYALEGEQLLIRTGWWRRRTLLLPLGRVQSATLIETALSRRFGIATLAIDVAGGSMRGQRIPSLPRKEATQLLGELLSRQP